MIPAEVLASDPAILEKAKELSERRICRLCLSEEDALVDMDVVWKMKILSCIPLVTIGSDKLPKFICEPCGKFVKKCFEFRQLCKKAEQLLVSYPLTGGWSGELVIPRWLHDEGHLEQVQVCKKRKAVEELVVPQVGSVRVRSHESMSLQSPTITPGSVEQTMQEMMVDVQPRQEVINSYPTMTPTATYAIPVIQSQPVSPQYPSSMLPYNSPTQFSHRAQNITPVNQPPQKIQRTNSIQNVPQLLLHPGYTMQQHKPQLLNQPQIQSCNTNLNNMNNMLAQLSSYPQPVVQQQQHREQFSYSELANQLQRPPLYKQNQQFPSTPMNHQQQPSITMTPIIRENYNQQSIPMAPTRCQVPAESPSITPVRIQMAPATHQQPSLPMNPSRSRNYHQPSAPMAPSINPTSYQHQQPQQPPPNKPVNLWCHVCNFKFLTVDHYQFHIRKHSTRPLGNLTGGLPGRLRTCRFCTAPTFPTQGDLVQHLKLHERVGLTKACDFCAKYFADEERRNEHYRKNHADVVRRTLKLNDQ
uniref:(northern house mosquito) hypothetical protein n=1 Tax=Culex pipiens TaxID=7175 RepID=A0A8D8C118_CULPI